MIEKIEYLMFNMFYGFNTLVLPRGRKVGTEFVLTKITGHFVQIYQSFEDWEVFNFFFVIQWDSIWFSRGLLPPAG